MDHFNAVVRYHDGMQERELSFVMESESIHTAMIEAPKVAETIALFGPKWISFETMRVSPVKFPYVIGDILVNTIQMQTR